MPAQKLYLLRRSAELLLAATPAISSDIGNTETLVLRSVQLPANYIKVSNYLRICYTIDKSGTADLATLRLRIGNAGTTADDLIFDADAIATAANRFGANIIDFRIDSTTTIQRLSGYGSGTTMGYNSSGTNTLTAAATIPDITSTALYISAFVLSAGTTDTVRMIDGQLSLRVFP